MKRYALLLACLAWTLGTSVYGQGAGGGAGGAGGGGAAGGAAGGAVGGAATGAGTAVGGSAGTGVGNSTVRTPLQPITPIPPLGGTVPGGVGTPGQPATGTGGGIGTGATGGVQPGVGGTGGVQPGVGGTGGVGPGVGGTGGTLAPETGIGGSTGVGSAIPMTPADTALTQQIRSQLLTPGNAGGVNTGVANSTVTSGMLTPQDLANVQVTANNGVIVLRGRVNNEAQRQLLENRVRHMNGVRSVIDGLVIAGPGASSGAVGTTTPGGSTIPGPTP